MIFAGVVCMWDLKESKGQLSSKTKGALSHEKIDFGGYPEQFFNQ